MLDKIFNMFKSKKTIDYVVLGASAAGINAAKTLRELDKDASIVLISKDEKIYSRCMLHHVISNHKTIEEINFVEPNFMEDNNIKWIKNRNVKGLDTNSKIIELEDQILEYDKLLIATGASAFVPPIKHLRDGNFVYTLRNLDELCKIKEKASTSKKAVVIGAGLVGIDALVGLLEYENLEVSLIYTEEYILNKQLDKYSASTYENKFIEKGAKLYPKSSIKEIVLENNKDVKEVKFEDGTTIECDFIVVATGVSPNADFVTGTNIEYNRGIVINDRCETTEDNIYAAGDVVGKNAIWPLAVKQGIVAAYNMVGKDKKIEDSFAFKNSMNFMGVATVSLGITNPVDDTYSVVSRCDVKGYKKFIYKDNVICGLVSQGDISYTGTIAYLIKNKLEIPNLENRIFDIGYADFIELKENGEFCYNI
ncbi:MAG: NAD(P)/FAD-dependent oxidoreductase [Romboutsia sp.]|uniref:NAD(P)/FAD-dependent oxidoreductase n=1 Tax=Romboutsia sp. TaxID=1965302 RepID=UPI003F3FA16F